MSSDLRLALLVAYNTERPEQPPSLAIYDDDLHPVIGRIITQWAMMEQEAQMLTTALLSYHSKTVAGWERRSFDKRWDLLTDEWSAFAAGHPELLTEFKEITADMRAGKIVRDGLAHKRIRAEITKRGKCIRFSHDAVAFPWSRQYYLADIQSALGRTSSALGRLYRLMDIELAPHFSSQSRSLLRQLPDMDPVRFPMPPARKPPPRP